MVDGISLIGGDRSMINYNSGSLIGKKIQAHLG